MASWQQHPLSLSLAFNQMHIHSPYFQFLVQQETPHLEMHGIEMPGYARRLQHPPRHPMLLHSFFQRQTFDGLRCPPKSMKGTYVCAEHLFAECIITSIKTTQMHPRRPVLCSTLPLTRKRRVPSRPLPIPPCSARNRAWRTAHTCLSASTCPATSQKILRRCRHERNARSLYGLDRLSSEN